MKISMRTIGHHTGLYFFVFGPNAGKYGPEKLRIWSLFTQCVFDCKMINFLRLHFPYYWFPFGIKTLVEVFQLFQQSSLYHISSRFIWFLNKNTSSKFILFKNVLIEPLAFFIYSRYLAI